MLFTSATFLFLFLPVVLVGHTLLLQVAGREGRSELWRRAANIWLLICSLGFYFWGEHALLGVMLISVGVDYVAGRWMNTCEGRRRLLGLLASLAANLALLGYFKYAGFAATSVHYVSRILGAGSGSAPGFQDIVLPLGISFYTFQSMSYSIDVYRRKVTPTRNLIDFACYVTLFPQLVAGPIIRYRDVASELRVRCLRTDRFAQGVIRFIFGLAKKLLLANPVAVTADTVFGLPPEQCGTWMVWGGVLAYTLQIYFDFSGYSDMAIGLGRMLGFEFVENFNYPYVARSLRDFWHRWHITLSTWFRDYLYIPLGGNRRGRLRTCVNLFAVFFLCGLWHGASLTFIVWGLYHGTFLVAERLAARRGIGPGPRWVQHAYALLVIMVGWVFFRADHLNSALGYLQAMVWWQPAPLMHAHPSSWLPWPSIAAVLIGIPLSTPVMPWVFKRLSQQAPKGCRLKREGGIGLVILLVLLLLIIYQQVVSGSYKPFLYFRF
jgi:alginate O-acetyltransferase complex protein AlgI